MDDGITILDGPTIYRSLSISSGGSEGIYWCEFLETRSVGVDKIIRIILSREGLQVPYIHEVLS